MRVKKMITFSPTSLMLAYFFTKPLQGKLFRFFRNVVMDYVPIQDVIFDDIKMKENVGNQNKSLICDDEENNNESNSDIFLIEIRTDGYIREETNDKNKNMSGKLNILTQNLLRDEHDTSSTYLKKNVRWADII